MVILGDKSIKRRLETLELDKVEQVRAMGEPVHERIFALLDDRGACCAEELAKIMDMAQEDLEGYLQGLVSIDLMDEIEKEGKILYLPVARFFNLDRAFLSTPEGRDTFRELLVEKFAEMAQKTTMMGEELYDQGCLSFHRFNLTDEEFKEARKRIVDVLTETAQISEQSSGTTHLYQAMFFMYPVARESDDPVK